MSLILQALKKAEAERSLGRVPTLDQVAAAEPAAAPRRHAAVWAGMGSALIAVLALGAWWGFDRGAAPMPVVVAPPLAASVVALPVTVPPVAPVAVPAAPASTALPVLAAKPAPPATPAQRSASPASSPRAEPAPPSIHELPVALRQALPPLPVTGSIWSPTPSERMLILAGEIRREGDRITPELELVSIGQRAALLRFRDQTFRLPY